MCYCTRMNGPGRTCSRYWHWSSHRRHEGDRNHFRRQENDTRRRGQDWLNGLRVELWTLVHTKPPQRKQVKSDAADDFCLSDGASLERPHWSKRTSSSSVRSSWWLTISAHSTRKEQGNTQAGRAQKNCTEVDADQIKKALLSFPSTSGAGPTGLRPSHLEDALHPSSSDFVLRLLGEVVSVFLRKEIPESVRPLFCGAAFTALRRPNVSNVQQRPKESHCSL